MVGLAEDFSQVTGKKKKGGGDTHKIPFHPGMIQQELFFHFPTKCLGIKLFFFKTHISSPEIKKKKNLDPTQY